MPQPDPLVIVIGAGASAEVKLPTGAELTKSIAQSLDFNVDHSGVIVGGSEVIRQSFRRMAQASDSYNSTLNEYFQSARKIFEAMPLAPSIDNFIDSHRTDKNVALVGKLAIASCILNAEMQSTLYVNPRNIYNKPDFWQLRGTWFAEVFSLFTQYCAFDDLEKRLSRLTVISFNYDRCFKQFLSCALLAYYSISQVQADEMASKVTVLHPYGSVGKLRFESSRATVDFGQNLKTLELTESAEAIRTFTESSEIDTKETQAIRECVEGAKTLVYLGFAFHPLNLELLYGSTPSVKSGRDCDVFATAKGLSESNQSLIHDELIRMGGYFKMRVKLHSSLTAGGLISEYSRRLAQTLHSSI